jgi:maleylpyruvate isomerase
MPSGASAYGWEIPYLRVRELEIHHVDLALGYTPADWSAEFATRTLDQLAPFFRQARDCPVGVLLATDGDGRWEVAPEGPELRGPRRALAAWLTGRATGEGLELRPAGPVPVAPRWA